MLSLLGYVIFGLSTTLAHTSAQPAKAFRTTVSVSVSADEPFQAELVSFLNREICALGDVEIVDDGEAHRISVVALKSTLVGGTVTGYAVSVVVSTPLAPSLVDYVVKLVPAANQEVVRRLLRNQESMETHRILTTDRAGLKELAERVIANFDTNVIEPDRKIWRELSKN